MPAVVPILGQIALNAAIGIGASMLANALRPQKTNTAATTSRGLRFEMLIGEAVPVSAIWGRGRTGGQLTFAQEYGANNEWLKFKIDCGRGWYDALEGVIADDKALTLTGSNADTHGQVVEEYRDAGGTPRMWIKWYSGAPGQAADAGLIAAAPTRWGASHTATATPYIIVTLNYQPDMFPGNQLPTFGPVWRGLRLYDWRKDGTMPGGAGTHRWDDQSTWEWTDNPVVMAWNWRRGYWRNGIKLFGMGFSRYANDLGYFTAAANLADEELYFEETASWISRYAFGREISDDEEHLAVLRQFEESWCGSSFDRGGAYAPVPAAAMLPVLTLEDRHRIDGAVVCADRWGKVSAKKTNVHGSYSPVSDLFIAAPYASRINVDLQALTRGPKAIKFDQLYEHRPERAQMRAEIALRRNLFAATRTETFGPVANVLEPGDAVTRNCEWGATLMIVDSVEVGPDGLGRVVTLTGWSNTIVPDPDEGFLDLPPDLGTLPTAASRTLQVPGFDIDPLQRVTGGNEEPFARAAWSAIEDPNCDQVLIKVWPTAIPTEVEEFAADARLATARIIGPLRPNTAYTGIAQLTRRDLRRTYDTDAVTFTTGAFRPGEIGPNDLTDEVNASRAWASRSIEQLNAINDAMIAHFADAMLGGAVDRQTMRTEITARFEETEQAVTAAYTLVVDAIASDLGALVTRTELLEASVFDVDSGLEATATALSLLSASVDAEFTATASAIIAVEASIGQVLAGGNIAIEAVAAPAGWAVRASFAIWGGSGFAPVGLYMDAKADGTRRIVLDSTLLVTTGTQRSVSGNSFINWNTGAMRLAG
jgi:hypothetical protein